MNVKQQPAERHHSEAAEGDEGAEPLDSRAHSQTAAEGDDFDDFDDDE
ncbi:hypothetical protein [Arthrobacter sp. PAMC25284]|nr:hypothetical protein [Arthrobacter sp. PAMC25284]QYF89230.1 hypothetical protein KY499_14005 [Arthrobacter sp. PAMC25284]